MVRRDAEPRGDLLSDAAFQGRHVVVTGAGGGLGAAVVEQLLARGATVHAPVRGAWTGDARVQVTRLEKLDDEAAVTAYYAGLPALWASLHVIGGFAMAPITETSLADFESQWRTNTLTCFLTCREAVRAMRRGKAGGRIVNVAARPAVTPAPGMIAYAASKAAVASITQSLAAEVASDGILVNAVLPSIIDTPANRAAMPGADFAGWPKPAELAEAVLYLASPANALTSGALLPAYGRA
jgi:NAD(P)-dependent dehydrogenase (short-subunit alcohol dehydrogenase family)